MSVEEEEEEEEEGVENEGGQNEWKPREQIKKCQSQFKLINEAIKRILLDVVIRGHGDRLIGRWSREPEIHKFLEDVPYMLDRINQLHLCCSQVASLTLVRSKHPQYQQHHSERKQTDPRRETASLLTFKDFINLIGDTHHWLVRTRDQLGLTPLHKAVLFHNDPVAEYIADRYADQLAPPSNWHNFHSKSVRNHQSRVRLLDAQDKYGRTALHYAAIHSKSGKSELHKSPRLYRFLVAKGASEQVVDFQGRTASFYVEHPENLRARSIIHLANKLNASYQATVLSKTLRAGKFQGRLADVLLATPLEVSCVSRVDSEGLVAGVSGQTSRCLLSVSCSELAGVAGDGCGEDELALRGRKKGVDRGKSNSSLNLSKQPEVQPQIENAIGLAFRTESPIQLKGENFVSGQQRPLLYGQLDSAKKQLISHRIERPVLDEKTKQSIKRALNDGLVERITELTRSGFGGYIMGEARASCWNQQCKRYLERILPKLLESLDKLHEAIAMDELDHVDFMVNRKPILARIRRPYQVGCLSALHIATQLNRGSIVQRLLARFPELVNEVDSRGASCLHWAARLPPHQQQLYHWLLERYSVQLEWIKDLRGRLAVDYLNKSKDSLHPDKVSRKNEVNSCRSKDLSVDDILRQNQEYSNDLKLIGMKEPVRIRPTKSSVVKKVSNEKKRINTEEKEQKVNTSRRQFESNSTPLGDSPTFTPEHIAPQIDDKTDQTQNMNLVEVINKRSLPDKVSSDSEEIVVEEGVSDEQVLLGEMTQLELNDELKLEDSSSTSSSRTPETSINRIQSVLSKAIQEDDTRHIERLILAGCGRTVMELYDVHDSPFNTDLSEQVNSYMSRNAPKLVSLVQEIHTKVHACFTHSQSKQQSDQCFNSICKLLSCNSLCMCRDCFGATPLQVSLMRCDRRLAEYLLRRQPEAASGPDQLNRSGLHYAAIALRAFKGHGPFKLALIDSPPGSYWLVDDTIQTLYDNLKLRFDDSIESRDKRGKTCDDYLKECKHENSIGVSTVGLVEPDLAFKICCPDYAQILNNYNYFILNEIEANQMSEAHQDYGEASEQVTLPDRSLSCETKESPEDERQMKHVKLYQRSSTFEDLLSPLDTHIPATPDWDPKGQLRQLAPLPTVGSTSGFQEGPSPVFSSSSRPSLGNLKKSDGRKTSKHLQFTTSSKQRKASIKEASIGGVIVPTASHDGSTQETYDIVSRNNSASAERNTRTSCRKSNHSSSENLMKTLDPRRLITPASEHQNSPTNSSRFVFDAGCETGNSSSSSDDSDVADSRVEHLSDEFQNKVRIEKSELRKRVDQIMKEIKMSAKSSNSSRVLMSPLNDNPTYSSTTTHKHPLTDVSSLTSTKHSTSSYTTSLSASSISSCSSSNCSRKIGASTQTEEPSRNMKVQEVGCIQQQSAPYQVELMSKNSYGQTYLHFIASKSQSPSTFYRVLEHARHLLGERDIYYRSPRDVAVQFNLANNVQVLDKFIIGLFINGHTRALQQLLNQAYLPLIHVADADGNDIMMILKLLKLDRMVQFLLQMADFQRWRDELHTFIRHGYLGGVQELIKKNSDLINAKSVHSRSSLHLAVLFNRIEMVDLLIAHDPTCIHATDNMNRTPLHYAFGIIHTHNSHDIKQKLLDAGSSLEARDVKMRTPKYYYIFRRDIDEIRRMELELN